MNYFRAFRLIGTEAIDEYYSMASELALYQNNIYTLNLEKPNENTTELELKLNECHQKMHTKYGMIPHLHYHAMAETGYVSKLVDEKTYKQLKKQGEVKEGQARKLEMAKDEKTTTGYSIPVFKIDNSQSIQDFEKLLLSWQDIKKQLKEASKNNSPQLMTLTEQYEAFKKDLKDKYQMNPESKYVFETLSVGIYMGCSDAHLQGIAIDQKAERKRQAKQLWENSKN